MALAVEQLNTGYRPKGRTRKATVAPRSIGFGNNRSPVQVLAEPQQQAKAADLFDVRADRNVYWQTDGVTLYCGDALHILPTLPAASVDAIITSPPYAEQRQKQYGGIPANRYPVWTANWFMAVEKALRPHASILVNIREHIRKGEISDYVHKTRLLIREIGFVECEEVIWIKPDAPPLGSTKRPRRSYERILWFGLTGNAYCDPRANGTASDRIGYPLEVVGSNNRELVAGFSKGFKSGISRHRDYVECRLSLNERGVDHPARYPVALSEWLIRGWSAPGFTVLDCFMGSGSTGVGAVQNGRKFIGIELNEKYCAIARERIETAINVARGLSTPSTIQDNSNV